ncbi:caspase-9 isoform X2 [Pundamilia nyererei]|uniref:Caspase-9 isoform X2 n=1 Tax=Pundamilia nyererei TaxID=303518 RepID=A0A9Y3R2R8_9CICH|nr:PREDICTED: caspase-9 isoform X2 [Pundamilia nyererei]
MDEIHKKILQRNRSNLVKDLDPSKLYDGLLEKGIFTQDMIDEIQSAGTRRNQARQLVQDLETRGSRAFPLFLQCLQETGQESLAELLQNGAPATPTQVVRPEIQPLPITPPVDGNKPGKDVKKPQIPSSSPPGGEKPRPGPGRGYKMDASPCGHCLIINNMEFEPHSMLKNRKGSNIDCEKLERRFKTLNFVVEVRTNLRQKQIKHELLTLSKKDHSQYDCCVVIMLSHGTEVNHNRFPGAVYGVDGQYVPVQHITNYLNGQHCPSLQGKPKLFFIQACGGDEKDMGFEVSPDEVEPSSGGVDDQTDAIPMSSSSDSLSMSDEPDARPTLPTPSDILVSYSTFPGYVSWRETQSGSWYVQTLDCILEESAATVDLVTMLMMVNNEVSQNSAKGLYKQMPGSFNFLRKLLYFQTQT